MSVALYVSRLPSRFGRFFAPTVSYASSFARYQHTSARVLTPSDSKGPQPSFPCMLNSFPRHNRKLCPQIEAPMRFEGEWKRCSSNGVSKYAFARLDFVVTLVLDPSTWAISSVKLGLEKRGRLPASQEKYLPPHRRYTGELVANIQLEVSLEQLKELMSGDIDSKSVFELSALNDLTNEESSGSLTGKIGFQNRCMYIKLQSPEHQLITALKAAQTSTFRLMASYATNQHISWFVRHPRFKPSRSSSFC